MSQGGLDVIGVEDSSRWKEVLERIESYDFYHLPEYHRLAGLRGEGIAQLLSFRRKDVAIAMPILLRSVDVRVAANSVERVFDVTSVYGYPGPVCSGVVHDEDVAAFTSAVNDYLGSQGVVCAFSRLHPLLAGGRCLQGIGEVIDVGFTVSKDLTLTPAEQRSGMDRTFRRNVNRLVRLGYRVEEGGPECLEAHARIYKETMDRAHAGADYYYDLEYFRSLMQEMPEQAHLFVCRLDGEVTSTVFAMLCRGILQGHLGGSASAHLQWSPMKLVFYGMSGWGTEHGAHTLHLGGGIGARRDSLFAFKKAFSQREHVYQVWKHVAAPARYRELSRAVEELAGCELTGYFPTYRHPKARSGVDPKEVADMGVSR